MLKWLLVFVLDHTFTEGILSKMKKHRFASKCSALHPSFGSYSSLWLEKGYSDKSECGFRNLGLKQHSTENPSPCTS